MLKVISKESKRGICSKCSEEVYEMVFIKEGKSIFNYVCNECIGTGENRRKPVSLEFRKLDEERLAREEILNILLDIAYDDEKIFKDDRLTVVNSFKKEILEGTITDRLEKYIRFNGNDIRLVMNLREMALECVKVEGEKFKEVVGLYIESRIRKLTEENLNKIKILMADKDIQMIHMDKRLVWDNLTTIKEELSKVTSEKRYDNIVELRNILRFEERREYLTDRHVRKLKSFYFEMMRRKNK